MKKILIFPEPKLLNGNLYLFHLAQILSAKYMVLDSSNGYASNLFHCDLILLNWFESITNNPLLLAKRLLFLFVAFCSRKKIIWTVHNKQSHDGACVSSKIVIFLLLRMSWKIHILCRESFNIPFLGGFHKKCFLIPHGDYFGDFSPNGIDIRNKYQIDFKSKIILFSGAVKPYKNIELLISAFSKSHLAYDGFVLLIRGACSDKLFERKIYALAKMIKGVIFDSTFIPIPEMYDYLNQSCCLVAPYKKDSALNSGTLWMALSYKKTMIIPQIGSVLDIPNASQFLYTYSYETEIEHEVQLENTFCKLSEDVHKFHDCLEKKGLLGYEYIKSKSWEKQKEKWFVLFS